MAVLNPSVIKWSAPTQDVEGNTITQEMAYNLYRSDQQGPVASFPGTLNPDGKYQITFDEVGATWPKGETVDIGLTAFYTAKPEIESALSSLVSIQFVAKPSPPFSLAVS
jgi:hypothetical protein